MEGLREAGKKARRVNKPAIRARAEGLQVEIETAKVVVLGGVQRVLNKRLHQRDIVEEFLQDRVTLRPAKRDGRNDIEIIAELRHAGHVKFAQMAQCEWLASWVAGRQS